MIESYEIKKINGEEILCLYLDFNNEFSTKEFKKKKDKLQKIIKNFIKENKIAFTGTTVALIVGSTLLGNIYLNDENNASSLDNNIAIVDVIEDYEEITKQDKIEVEDIIKEDDDIKQEEDNKITNQDNITEDNNIKEVSHQQQVKEQTINQAEESINQVTENNTQSNNEIVEETKQEDNNIYITLNRTSGEVLNIELEEYVIGVVGAEMPAAFDKEALKAQAIIARTYALKAKNKGNVLSDNASSQYYKTNEELQVVWGSNFNTYYNKIKDAVLQTKGLYLSYNGSFIEAVYHSTSNGKTESSENVWGNYYPYLVSVDSPYDNINKSFEMKKTITYEELSLKLQMDVNINTEFNILGKTSGNRVANIEINGNIYRGIDFRNLLALRSADFDITKTEEGVIFTTYGYGHGVGMSQYGANGLAKNGYSYSQILLHYYPGVEINHL